MSGRIPVCEPWFWGNEQRYVNEALDSRWISSAGRFLTTFEEQFASYCGVAHGVAVANGTVALHLALLAAGIRPGDEVLVADFVMFSPVLAIVQAGARPVFVDAEPDTWTMDPAQVERCITPRTRALLAVHTYGHPCDMDALGAIARRHGLVLIEDAAEAHGATVRGRRCGSLAALACFSFYANKIITTGEGGMVVTDDAALAAHLRSHRNLCFGSGPQRYLHEDFGYNYRLTNLQAALGVAQLEHVAAAVARKRAIAMRYNELLADVPGLTLPVERDWATNVYWVYGILVGPQFGCSRDELMSRLDSEGIETRPFFTGMHRQSLMQPYLTPGGAWPVSARLGACGLYLPSYMHLSEEQLQRVAGAVRAAARRA
jgi:perosamine synthetase